ncbi:MAG: hypothetical protein DRH57_00405 [Candidatus Cloacimonadota bacterium]|nr:MAG: hypothetical protein DRH57_00405 [Candidatus Cloacimonadota bacterium]
MRTKLERYISKSFFIVILFILLLLSCSKNTNSELTVRTLDRKDINIYYYPSFRHFAPAIVLVPSIGQNQSMLSSFIKILQQNGFAVITYDFRNPITRFDYPRLKFDVQASTEYLMKKEEIDKYKITIIAYNNGIEPALQYVSENQIINSTVLIYPNDMNRYILKEMLDDYKERHLLIITTSYDEGCYETSKFIYDTCLSNEKNKKLLITRNYKKDIESLDKQSLDFLINWLIDESIWK